MALYKKILILVGLLLLLAYFNWSVFQKENTLKDGTLVLLKLAPVDPRSLMQGDYMNLRYDINLSADMEIAKNGYCILELDSNHVGHIMRLQESSPATLESGEISVKYKSNGYGSIRLGAESYFFEEGQASLFENAVYGGLKIDSKGNSILIGLYDEGCQLIKKPIKE